MAFLSLKDIGKIYVSDNNVTVGIRGINLSFEKGEFVAVTGKSGSGKSTLLNVISGMDTYEEGELFIEEQPTSHYLQPDWEEYRSKYISFIFQDYNIIESFTVLQNVELALMNIEDKKERRKRALELIDRVGMTSHIKHKGSKLSGGQKQRTVIARALAKDSPIILADEPTGNLDSATSIEIIELLKEVSKDKLLIVVTHNYEEVERHATRHIRFFDGAVESDTMITSPIVSETYHETKKTEIFENTKKKKIKDFKDGFTLGKAIFVSKPKLSIFLCLLMILGTFGVFATTSSNGSAAQIFKKHYMFENIEGRLIVTKRSGDVITEEELEKLATENGAKSFLHYDSLLDNKERGFQYYDSSNGYTMVEYFECTYNEEFGDDIIGSYPKEANEVLLYLPLNYAKTFGEDSIKVKNISFSDLDLKVTGIKYYYDNNLTGKCLFTREGFEVLTAVHYLSQYGKSQIFADISKNGASSVRYDYFRMIPSFDVEEGKIYIDGFDKILSSVKGDYTATINFMSTYSDYNYYSDYSEKSMSFEKKFSEDYISTKKPSSFSNSKGEFYIHPSLMVEIAEDVLSKSYTQASIFFESDKKAAAVSEKLNDMGYLAVPANTTYEPNAIEVVANLIGGIISLVLWFLSIVFFAFFINLCSSRTLSAFKGDMAIMRSMGISVSVIRKGMYVRMFIALIPAFISVVLGAFFIFTSPKLNGMFYYLYADQYLLIFVGMIILTYRITRKQIKKLFSQSVKKSLKGGDAE